MVLKEHHNFFHLKTLYFLIPIIGLLILAYFLMDVQISHLSWSFIFISFAILFCFSYDVDLKADKLIASFKFFGIKLITKELLFQHMIAFSIAPVRPIRDWLGWGYRIGVKGTGFIFPTSGLTLHVKMIGDINYYFTITNGEEFVRYIKASKQV